MQATQPGGIRTILQGNRASFVTGLLQSFVLAWTDSDIAGKHSDIETQ